MDGSGDSSTRRAVVRQDPRLLECLLDLARVGVAISDENGTIVEWTPRMTELAGFGGVELVGASLGPALREFLAVRAKLPERVLDAMVVEVDSLLKRGATRAGDPIVRMSRGALASSGLTLSVAATAYPRGHGFGVAVIARDVTTEECALAEATESRTIAEAVVAGSPDIIYSYRLPGMETVFANRELWQVLGYTWRWRDNTEFLAEVVHPDDLESLAAHQAALYELPDGAWLESEARVRDAKGRWRWIRSRDAVLRRGADGAPAEIVARATDTTVEHEREHEMARYRRSLERLVEQRTTEFEEADHERNRILANVTHDLRSPLGSVVGFSEVMLSGAAGPITEEQRIQLAMIRDTGRHMLAVVGDLLQATSVNAAPRAPDVQPLDASAVVGEIVAGARVVAEGKGLDLGFSGCSNAAIETDRDMLWQIVQNLVDNAIKYTERGGVYVTCSLEGDEIAISVADTGPGIPADQVDSLFDEFSRLDAMVAGAPGTGLGLSIAKRFAGVLGGRIDVVSRVGEGSTFLLYLPLESGTGRAVA